MWFFMLKEGEGNLAFTVIFLNLPNDCEQEWLGRFIEGEIACLRQYS